MFSGKWPLDPLRHDWPMTRILRPKELAYSRSKIIPPGLLGTANIITPFWNIPPPNNKQGMNVGIARPQFLETIKFVDLIPTFPSILKILLEKCRGHAVTNPLDAIYALFGLADHLMEMYNVKHRNRKFQVDYKLPVWVVFQTAARIMLEGTPSLSLLSFWSDLTIHNVEKLPSWVPDFSRRFDDTYPNIRIYAHNKDAGFNAADIKHKFPAVRQVDRNRLLICGYRVDTIERHAAIIEEKGENWVILESILELCLELDLKYLNGQDRVEALQRTLEWELASTTPSENRGKFWSYIIGHLQYKVYRMAAFEDYSDYSYGGVNDPRSVVREQAETHIRILHLCEKLAKDSSVRLPTVEEYTEWVTRFVDAFCHEEDEIAQEEALSAFSMEAVMNCIRISHLYSDHHMRLFRGAKSYIGLGPAPSTVDDEVWILENSRMPFILRRVEDGEEGEHQYRLLGEAYVHGIMHRELFLDTIEDEKPKFEKLIII